MKHWSRTQASRALSTAEAEYHAVVRGAAEGLGMQSVMTDSARVREGRWKRLKWAGRYVAGWRKVTWELRAWDSEELKIGVHSDSNWVAGPERKSTSGGMRERERNAISQSLLMKSLLMKSLLMKLSRVVPDQVARPVPSLQQPQSLFLKIGLLRSQSAVPRNVQYPRPVPTDEILKGTAGLFAPVMIENYHDSFSHSRQLWCFLT